MKNLRKLCIFFSMALIPILSACSGGGSSGSGGSTTSAAAQGISFSIAKSALVAAKATGKSVAAETLDPAVRSAAVIVKDSSGATVLDMYKTEIYSLNGSYITATIPLAPASYQLAGFFLLDADNKVLYSVPTQSATAEIKAMVTTVLPISFGVTKDVTNTISLQVLAVGEATANDFGYPSIIFDVVTPSGVKFMTDVQILDVPGRNWQQISASLKVNNMDYVVNDVTTTLRVQEAASYTLIYSKPGYASKTITLTAAEMVTYQTYPLVVILNPGFEDYVFDLKWGGDLSGPVGIAVDQSGNVYVTDQNNNEVQKFSATGTFITKWGGLNYPVGIAIDASGNVYVVDNGNNRIQKFDLSGNLLATIGEGGSGDGQLNYPCGIAVDQSGNVYVADTNNQRVQKFSSTGSFITKWGVAGSNDGEFTGTYGIAVDQSGNVYVTDYWADRIQKFSPTGAFITKWGSNGTGDGQFSHPTGVAVDNAGDVYVASWNNFVQKFSPTGTFITKWGGSGSGDGEFSYPWGVAFDQSAMNMYVSENGNGRVTKFHKQ